MGSLGLDPTCGLAAGLLTHSSKPSLLMPQFSCNVSPALGKNNHWCLAQDNDWMYAVTFVGREYISWMWVGSVGKVEC